MTLLILCKGCNREPAQQHECELDNTCQCQDCPAVYIASARRDPSPTIELPTLGILAQAFRL